jgi:hypothetical protein
MKRRRQTLARQSILEEINLSPAAAIIISLLSMLVTGMLEFVSFCEHSATAIDESPDSRLLLSMP